MNLLSHNLWRRLGKAASLPGVLGGRAAATYLYNQLFGSKPDYLIRPYYVPHPLHVRRDSSDLLVFNQIFVNREYRPLDDLNNVQLVIDCGANVGYSSSYFLARHANCHVIAVEPDPNNFAALRRNLSGYGSRAKLVQSGVWSSKASLVFPEEDYRDGLDWSKHVRLCGPDEKPDVEGIDIGSLLADSGFERISVLKMDIEGAEAVVFSENYQAWLDKVDVIAIELHRDSPFGDTRAVFHAAIEGQGFQCSHNEELTICRR